MKSNFCYHPYYLHCLLKEKRNKRIKINISSYQQREVSISIIIYIGHYYLYKNKIKQCITKLLKSKARNL